MTPGRRSPMDFGKYPGSEFDSSVRRGLAGPVYVVAKYDEGSSQRCRTQSSIQQVCS